MSNDNDDNLRPQPAQPALPLLPLLPKGKWVEYRFSYTVRKWPDDIEIHEAHVRELAEDERPRES